MTELQGTISGLPMSKSETLILIPAFNEAATIANVVCSAIKYGDVLVLDDASSDGTKEKALEAGADVIVNHTNLGYEKNLSVGYQAAINELGYSFLITIDGDGEHNPNDIPRFVARLRAGVDIVCGNRSFKNRFSEHIWCYLSIIIYGIKDPLCGLRGYSLQFIRSNKKNLRLESLGSCIGTYLTKMTINLKGKRANLDIDVSKRKGDSKFGSGLIINLRILAEMVNFLKI